MSVTRVTQHSWGSRLGNSIKGVIVGLVMVAASVMLLFWNEGRAVRRAKALAEGASTVITVDATAPAAANEGKLVHFTGETSSFEPVEDSLFGVEADAVKIERKVEMYQWQEHSKSEERKKLGGGTERVTTYTYDKTWSTSPIDSSRFEETRGHENPSMPFQSSTTNADMVVIGDWILSDAFVAKMNKSEPLRVDASDLAEVSFTIRGDLVAHGGGFYRGDPSSATIGDVRVTFSAVPHAQVSVVGGQSSGTLVGYTTKTVDGNIALLGYGVQNADTMFQAAEQANTVLTWILRGVGFFICFLGFSIVLKPLSVMADVVPMIGNVVEAGTGFVSFLVAGVVSFVTIAIGWIFYRPLLGISMLLIAGALVVWLVKKLKEASQRVDDKWTGQQAPAPAQHGAGKQAAPPPPPPPPPAS